MTRFRQCEIPGLTGCPLERPPRSRLPTPRLRRSSARRSTCIGGASASTRRSALRQRRDPTAERLGNPVFEGYERSARSCAPGEGTSPRARARGKGPLTPHAGGHLNPTSARPTSRRSDRAGWRAREWPPFRHYRAQNRKSPCSRRAAPSWMCAGSRSRLARPGTAG